MLIPITISAGSPSASAPLPPQLAKLGNDELVLIELQGALDVECTDPSERDGQLVGKFRLDEGSDKPTLSIGHHLLEGKIVSLSKPLGVMQRTSGARGAVMGDEGMEEVAAASVQWDVVAIVKKKIVFSKRPMPIVGRTAAPTSKTG
ncbi:hypothetical protein HWV62_22125 [Athelia sp. TMB]|nr:hypothetical protein HWV62_22125 [Athelia sp. TMB]